VSGQGCGAPVRDRGHEFIIIGICGVAIAILSFLMRLGASLVKNGRKMSWDDTTMGIVVALSIPPAVFTFFCKSESPHSSSRFLTATQWSTTA
jgi:hypothetical protein